MKAYKETIRTYYKYVYDSFSQPVLSANGTIGENAFAVLPSAQDNSYPCWKAFDNNTSTFWCTAAKTLANQNIVMYNPVQLNVTGISITNKNNNNAAITAGTVYGSDDNLNWNELTTFTNSVTTALSVWSIDLSGNTEYYKYYKLAITSSGGASNNRGAITEVSLTATERTVEESTSSDYDFYIDTYNYKAYEKNGTYKAFNV